MKRLLPLLFFATTVCALFYACDKEAAPPRNFENLFNREQVTASPRPLQLVEQEKVKLIPVSFRCEVPARMVPRKALFTLTPILICEKKEYMGTARTWQGDRVEGGNEVISFDEGARLYFNDSFAYEKEMDTYDLYLAVNIIEDLKLIASYRIQVESGKLQIDL